MPNFKIREKEKEGRSRSGHEGRLPVELDPFSLWSSRRPTSALMAPGDGRRDQQQRPIP
jgi:hypothetical protein